MKWDERVSRVAQNEIIFVITYLISPLLPCQVPFSLVEPVQSDWAEDSSVPCLIVSSNILQHQTYRVFQSNLFGQKVPCMTDKKLLLNWELYKRCEVKERENTGKPTATLSKAILFSPARSFTFSLYVNLRFSLVPKAEPI